MAVLRSKRHKKKIFLFTGAPKRKDLSWKNDDLTTALQHGFHHNVVVIPNASGATGAWRELSRETNASGCSPIEPGHCDELQGQQRETIISTISATAPLNISCDNFIPERISFVSGQTSISADESFWNTSTAPSPIPVTVLDHIKITQLSDLPSVENIQHHTRNKSPFFNLVVIVLAASTRRMLIAQGEVTTPVNLVRLTAADETNSGFEISIWLDCKDEVDQNNEADQYETALRNIVCNLHRNDIILVENVALRAFKGKVNGTSLRRMTVIHLLHRDSPKGTVGIVPRYSAASIRKNILEHQDGSPVVHKVIEVLKWKDNFLQAEVECPSNLMTIRSEEADANMDPMRRTIQLPEDTQ